VRCCQVAGYGCFDVNAWFHGEQYTPDGICRNYFSALFLAINWVKLSVMLRKLYKGRSLA
jgi:hypothetical protein